MKKVNFTLSVAATLLLLIAYGKANAQTARLQLIHNAAAVSLDTVDIYLDDTKFDNVAFRSATPLLTVASGAHTVRINSRNSADSGDMVLSRFPLTLTANQNHLALVAGVDTPANYAANPNTLSTALTMIVRSNVSVAPLNNNQTALNFFHGTTDGATWDIFLRPSTQAVNDITFGQASANYLVNSGVAVIDLRDAAGTTVLKSYSADFTAYAKRSLAVFTSGFNNTALNQNGAGFGVFFVDTNGGVATQLTDVARLQFVNNSADITLDSVDVWVNNTRVADNLAFRKATAMITMNAGTHDITIARKTSVDTSAATVLVKLPGIVFASGNTKLAVVSGVVDTTLYAANPGGIDRSVNLSMSNVSEGAAAGMISYTFYAGIIDAPAMDLNKLGLPSVVKVGDNVVFRTISPAASVAAGNTMFSLTSADNSVVYGTYRLNTTGSAPKAGTIITSGIFDTTGNPASAKRMALFMVYNDGVVTELTKLGSQVQFVHNSADVTADTVDIYINGAKALTNFAFRTATPFMTMDAGVPYSIAVAPKGSANVGAAFYTQTLTFDSSANHYVIANGVRNTAQYVANPNGRNIAFKFHTYSGARKLANNSKNTDLLYFHGATDLAATTIIGVGQVQFLSKNDAYGDFHGYAIHSAQDNIMYPIRDAVTDTIIKTVYGNLATHQGKAGLVFASGFSKANSTTNQNGDTLILFVAWEDGDVDSIAPPQITTGLREIIAGAQFQVYPNPANDVVNIALELSSAGTITSELTDITGKTVLSSRFQGTKGQNAFEMTTSALKPGMYFISIKADDQMITRKVNISR
jgi:hypothetical protein